MALRDVFIFEGRQDKELRDQTLELFKSVTPENVRWSGGKAFTVKMLPNLSLKFVLSAVPDVSAGTMALNREQYDEPIYITQSKIGEGRMVVIAHVLVNDMELDSLLKSPLADTQKRFIRMLMNSRDVTGGLMHELVHFSDIQRKGVDDFEDERQTTQAALAEPQGKLGKYRAHVQDPREQNAIFQHVAAEVEAKVPREQVMRMSASQFYRLFVRYMESAGYPNPDEHFRQRQIPHLKKRVAQLYKDITGTG